MSLVENDADKSRRTSNRVIKRKRELEDYDTMDRHTRPRQPSISTPVGVTDSLELKSIDSVRRPSAVVSRGTQKKSKKIKAGPNAIQQLGKWKPEDDLMLITAVQQTSNLYQVYQHIDFSCKFSLREIQERWYSLLYDPVISKLSVNAMRQLHPEIVAEVQANTLFSVKEEKLLASINSLPKSADNLWQFDNLLETNKADFAVGRTARSLYNHWCKMRDLGLLLDQKGSASSSVSCSLVDMEDNLLQTELRSNIDPMLEQELASADRQVKREIRKLEHITPRMQALVEKVTGAPISMEFDDKTLAVLKGRLMRYCMKSREVKIGRSTRRCPVDMNLSLEGPSWKISRLQAVLRVNAGGQFWLTNCGRRPIYVDGQPALRANAAAAPPGAAGAPDDASTLRLSHNSVVEIANMRFIFLINDQLVSQNKSGL